MLLDEEVTLLLADHARRLLAGEDATASLSAFYEAAPDVAALLFLARRLHHALQPIAPSAQFVRALDRQLLTDGRTPQPTLFWMLLATAGSLASVAGVTLLWHRRWRTTLRSRAASLT